MVKNEPVFLDFSNWSCFKSLTHQSVDAGKFGVPTIRKRDLKHVITNFFLFVHMSSKVTSSKYILVCPTCHATGFTSKRKLRGHLKAKHDVDLPSMNNGRPTEQDTVQNSLPDGNCYACPSCTLVFKTTELVDAHFKDHLPGGTSIRNATGLVKMLQCIKKVNFIKFV